MDINIRGILDNYGERVGRLFLYEPLFKLENKREKDNSGNLIDYFSLGLLSLLFFFENMIMRNRNTGVKELAQFFAEVNGGRIDLNIEGFERAARNIIDAFRPPSGKRNSKTFYNWEKRRYETVYYSILKSGLSDTKSNIQYYTLDEQGLELVFSTREYFSEFQISINQLLLRKQLEKGEFAGALRQIDEMRLAVGNLKDRIIKIGHEINRNIVSEESYERYKNLIEDINLRLARENEEFDELLNFVNDTKNKMEYEIKDEKDRKAYELIRKIHNELDEVHSEHRQLLKDSISLKTNALESAQESLYFIGVESFNFEEEITKRLVSIPLPLGASRYIINPFMYLSMAKTWSPLRVFYEQKIESERESEDIYEFAEPQEGEIIDEYLNITKFNFRKIMEIVIKMMRNKNEITLEEVVGNMQSEDEDILNHRSFYDFWIILHQKSPIILNDTEYDNNELFKDAFEIFKGKRIKLTVVEKDGIVYGNKRFSIKNMVMRLEENTDGI